jgi:hypothetical protein
MSRLNPRYHRINPLGTAVGVTNGLVRYILQGSIESQMTIIEIDFWAAVPAPTVNTLTTLLTNISAGVFASLKNLSSADWTCVAEMLGCIHLNNVMGVKSVTNAGTAGGRAAGHEPTEVAQPILKLTGLKGQHGRGRISIPAIATADVVGSQITAAAWNTAESTFATNVQAGFSDGAATWYPCVSTRVKGAQTFQYFSPVTSWRKSTYLGTIRRRKIGRGK